MSRLSILMSAAKKLISFWSILYTASSPTPYDKLRQIHFADDAFAVCQHMSKKTKPFPGVELVTVGAFTVKDLIDKGDDDPAAQATMIDTPTKLLNEIFPNATSITPRGLRFNVGMALRVSDDKVQCRDDCVRAMHMLTDAVQTVCSNPAQRHIIFKLDEGDLRAAEVLKIWPLFENVIRFLIYHPGNNNSDGGGGRRRRITIEYYASDENNWECTSKLLRLCSFNDAVRVRVQYVERIFTDTIEANPAPMARTSLKFKMRQMYSMPEHRPLMIDSSKQLRRGVVQNIPLSFKNIWYVRSKHNVLRPNRRVTTCADAYYADAAHQRFKWLKADYRRENVGLDHEWYLKQMVHPG